MGTLIEMLTAIVFFLLAVLLVIFIIVGLKLIETIESTNSLLDDLEKKSKSLDGVFSTIDNVGSSLSIVTDKFVDGALGFISKLFNTRKKKRKYSVEEDDFDE